MKYLFLSAAAFALLISASSCGNKTNAADTDKISDAYYDSIRKADSLAEYGPATELQYAQAQDKANDGKRVSITGYLTAPNTSYSSGSSGQLKFIERPNETGGVNFILSLPLGKGKKNSMKALPDKYKLEDVIVTGKNGETIGVGDRVKITGKLHANESYSSLDVQEIEKLEAVAIDYSALDATKITGPEKPGASMDGKFVSAEGTLEMPTLTMGGESTFLYLHVPGMKDQLTVNILYGTGPGMLEPLPENYSDNDIKIQDVKGNPLNFKKKVRVYGIWKSNSLRLEAVENI